MSDKELQVKMSRFKPPVRESPLNTLKQSNAPSDFPTYNTDEVQLTYKIKAIPRKNKSEPSPRQGFAVPFTSGAGKKNVAKKSTGGKAPKPVKPAKMAQQRVSDAKTSSSASEHNENRPSSPKPSASPAPSKKDKGPKKTTGGKVMKTVKPKPAAASEIKKNKSEAAAAPKKSVEPRKTFRGGPIKRKLSFEEPPSDSNDEVTLPQRHVPDTPVERKRTLESEETPVSRRQKRSRRSSPEDKEKENVAEEGETSETTTVKLSQKSHTSSASSFHSLKSRRSPFSDISNVSITRDLQRIEDEPIAGTSKQSPTPFRQPLPVPKETRTEVRESDRSPSVASSAASQASSSQYSLAPSELTPIQKLKWLLPRRMVGTWVQCDRCNKWRYIKDEHDPSVFPDVWHCDMSPDPARNTCAAPEEHASLKDEVLMISNSYAPGSLVYAQVEGYPWWPGVVDDDPDYEMFYWFDGNAKEVPTQYHVVFFDTPVSRAWVKVDGLKTLAKGNAENQRGRAGGRFGGRLCQAKQTSDQAARMNQLDRLKRFGFLAQYHGFVGDLEAPRTSKRSSKKPAPNQEKEAPNSPSSEADSEPESESQRSDVQGVASPSNSVSSVMSSIY